MRDGGLVFLPGGPVLRFDRADPIGSRVAPDRRAAAPARLAADARAPPARRAGRRGLAGMARGAAGRPLPRVGAGPPPPRLGAAGVARPGGTRPGAGERRRGRGTDPRRRRDRLGRRPDAGPPRDWATRCGSSSAGPVRAPGRSARSSSGAWLDHSALVQKLLREFRQGDPGRALRHAFSMAPADPRDRAGRVGQSAALEPRDLQPVRPAGEAAHAASRSGSGRRART